MKVLQFVPFHNENVIANLHLFESTKFVDEFHITESNMTFQCAHKNYNFESETKFKNLFYHKIDVTDNFLKSNKILPHFYPKNNPKWHPKVFRNGTWYNEGYTRNLSCKYDFRDDDILILSDIDEIIDSRNFDKIIDLVGRYKIITIKLRFTLFFLNLFSKNWGGPPDYSYRMFICKGSEFKKWNLDYDTLRKLGERGKLLNTIYCPNEILGFHHSWIGDENFISNKLKSYAHIEHSHLNNIDYIRKCIENRVSIFPGHELYFDEELPMLESVRNNTYYNKYLLKK